VGTLQLKNQPARKEQDRALEALQAGMERCAWPRIVSQPHACRGCDTICVIPGQVNTRRRNLRPKQESGVFITVITHVPPPSSC